MDITCLQRTIKVNQKDFPVLVGFLSAAELHRIAEVPAFALGKDHHEIARGLRRQPVAEWQRPLDDKRVSAIAAVFSEKTAENLMANPVLLGNAPNGKGCTVKPLLAIHGQKSVVVPDVFTLQISSGLKTKPLWVLDGQHRIRGLLKSSQKNQPIPVVILLDANAYPPNFLAKMFTQVTTEAQPMKALHSEWMTYAFEMGRYADPLRRKAMACSIELCDSPTLDGSTNELLGQIAFNPYLPDNYGYGTIRWDVAKWNDVLSSNYYAKGGNLKASGLATQVIRFIRAVFKLDTASPSRLTSQSGGHPLLMERFLSYFLQFLAKNPAYDTADQARWETFLDDPDREFGKCDWALSWIQSSSATSGRAHKPSRKATDLALRRFFFEPKKLKSVRVSEYLRGPDDVRLEAYKRGPGGGIQSKTDKLTVEVPGDGGTKKLNISQDGHARSDVKFVEMKSSLASVIRVSFKGQFPNVTWKKGETIDLTSLGNPAQLFLTTYCYSSDSEKETPISITY